MTNTSVRHVTRPSHRLLLEILEQPALARSIEALAAPVFSKLVRKVGLEDSAEILALATREQIELLLDDELWNSRRPGEDERFDPDRFALWLEVLLEAGDRHAVQRLTELSEELLLLGFSRLMLVIDIDALALEMSERGQENDWLEKALDSYLYHEFEQYRAIARRAAGWDAALGALLALDREHHDLVERILERCCAASSEYIEENGGLYEVLSSEEMLENDAAAEREDRGAAAGFVAPSSARSFLRLAEQTSLDDLVASKERDPVTRAYFRELAPTANASSSSARASRSATPAQADLGRLLRAAGVTSESPATPLLTGDGDQPALVTRALRSLKGDEPALYAARMEELAYLANVLAAGAAEAGSAGEARPLAAIERALGVCEQGLAYLLGVESDKRAGRAHDRDKASLERAIELIRRTPADKLFRVGWRRALEGSVAEPQAKARPEGRQRGRSRRA